MEAFAVKLLAGTTFGLSFKLFYLVGKQLECPSINPRSSKTGFSPLQETCEDLQKRALLSNTPKYFALEITVGFCNFLQANCYFGHKLLENCRVYTELLKEGATISW